MCRSPDLSPSHQQADQQLQIRHHLVSPVREQTATLGLVTRVAWGRAGAHATLVITHSREEMER